MQSTGIHWCDDAVNPTMGCDGRELWGRSAGRATPASCTTASAGPTLERQRPPWRAPRRTHVVRGVRRTVNDLDGFKWNATW